MDKRRYLITDGVNSSYCNGLTSLHACVNFLRNLVRKQKSSEPVLYVRTGTGGGLEYEVWYFTFQFPKPYCFVFPKALGEQYEEPLYLHGGIQKGTNEEKNRLRREKKEEEVRRQKQELILQLTKEVNEVEQKIKSNTNLEEKVLSAIPQDNPTKAAPGSKAKLNVLIARYEKGLMLWHPDDNDAVITVEEYLCKKYSDRKSEKDAAKTPLAKLSESQGSEDFF